MQERSPEPHSKRLAKLTLHCNQSENNKGKEVKQFEIHMKGKKVASEATERQKLFSTSKTTKGRRKIK